MTEQEWLACASPAPMLALLGADASERKQCLFDAACLRRVWHLLSDARSRRAVEVLETYAEGGTSLIDLAAANESAEDACNPKTSRGEHKAALAVSTATMRPRHPADGPADGVADAVASAAKRSRAELRHAECAAQASLLRDMYGNPFRPVTLDAAHRTPTIVALAQAVYDKRIMPSGELDAARLAVLADALEEAGAGCELLAHLRGGGAHVRGCWGVDLCLAQK